MSKHLADPRWRSPHDGLGGGGTCPSPCPPHATFLLVLSSERFLCNRARELLERAALEIELSTAPVGVLVESTHNELETPGFNFSLLIESISEGFWSLFPMPDLAGAFVENNFKVF